MGKFLCIAGYIAVLCFFDFLGHFLIDTFGRLPLFLATMGIFGLIALFLSFAKKS